MRIRNKKQSGFTLLELLVVVAILAIIAGAVISAISGQEELAGSKVAVHTMGALENAVRQQVVINGGLPDDLDSLVCATTTAADSTGDVTATAEVIGNSTDGGLADGLFGALTLVNLPADGDCEDDPEGACILEEAGIESLRYAELAACDDDEGTTATPNGAATAVGDEEAVELLANTLFWDADNNGAGLSLPLDDGAGGAEATAITVLADPTFLGVEPGTIAAVFGVGNFSEMSESETGKIISRGPVDGNVEGNGERYSHFSVVIKLGEAGTNANLTTAGLAASADWELDEVEVIGILDSDGDNYDDEIAEASGLEDE